MRRPLLAAIAGLALVGSLGGCVSLLPKTKPAQLYRFGAEAAPNTAPAGPTIQSPSGAQKTGVVLSAIEFSRASTSDGILTVTGDQTAYIGGARWVAPARVLFQEAVVQAFESHGQRTQIVNVGDVGPAGAVLRIDVTAFEARYSQPGAAPLIVVSLAARLNRSDGAVLDQRDFTVSKTADANGVAAIVRAFDGATDQILTDVTTWTDLEVSNAPRQTPPPEAVTSVTRSESTSTTTTSPSH